MAIVKLSQCDIAYTAALSAGNALPCIVAHPRPPNYTNFGTGNQWHGHKERETAFSRNFMSGIFLETSPLRHRRSKHTRNDEIRKCCNSLPLPCKRDIKHVAAELLCVYKYTGRRRQDDEDGMGGGTGPILQPWCPKAESVGGGRCSAGRVRSLNLMVSDWQPLMLWTKRSSTGCRDRSTSGRGREGRRKRLTFLPLAQK